MKKILLCLLTVLAFAAPVQGTTYYVRKTGNDSSNGKSWATAWATVSKVNTSISGGDTVFFATGLWRGQLIPASGASSGDRTCYACSSFVQGICKIYGGVQLTGWVQHSGNVYKTKWTSPGGQWTSSTVYTLGQDDSLLYYVSSLASVNSAGKFWHNTSTDTIYAWLYGNGNPNDYTMEASNRPVIFFGNRNKSYTTIWGFVLRYGYQGVIVIDADPKPNYLQIEHCYISRSSGPNGENPCGIQFRATSADTSTYGHFNVVRACSLGHFINPGTAWWHGSGITVYAEHNLVVESCYVFSPIIVGLEKKQRGDGSICRSTVFRYNTIYKASGAGIVAGWDHPYQDSVYGNTIIGPSSDGIAITAGISPVGDGIFVGNNTIYNTNYGLDVTIDAGMSPTPHKRFKYNLVSLSSPTRLVFMQHEDSIHFVGGIDSNFYYAPQYTFDIGWSPKTLQQWQSYGFDVHATTGVNPGFADPANGNFSRPGSSQEMNLTYGGRTWTRYGAWQPDNGGENHCPTSPTLNLPVNGDTILGARPTLSLNNAADADGNILVYDFKVCSDSQMTNLVVSGSDVPQSGGITYWQVTQDLPDKRWYWWKARSYDRICHSDWSEKRKFYLNIGDMIYGDLNRDGNIDIADVSYLINYLFRGGSPPQPPLLGDTNGDCEIDIADVVYLMNYLFKSGPVPKGGCGN